MVRASAVAALLLLALAPAAHAAQSVWQREAKGARKALARSVDAGYLTGADAQGYLGVLRHAADVRDRVPRGRALVIENVLAQAAKLASPTAPRALEVYSTLAENADYLAAHRLPPDGTDVTGAGGVVYRYFPNQGLEFHPLANATQLNLLAAAGDTAAVRALAAALEARAVPQRGGALVWEYEFNFGSERAPWSSGMAQAVMAQAFARAGYLGVARRAFAAIPGRLDRMLPAGPWIRLYSGKNAVVLNAQLQSAISLTEYARRAGDERAAALAQAMLAAAKTMLPAFDTGHWTRYSLREQSSVSYQNFVISLLKSLAKSTGDATWQRAADRFSRYESEPPLMTGTSVTRDLYPRPHDGVRDDLVVRYFLSKPSKVALVVDGKAVDGYRLAGGWHSFRWYPQGLRPGAHRVRLVAADVDGNPGATELGSFLVLRDTELPRLAAAKGRGRVYWHAVDAASACCRLELELRRPGQQTAFALRKARGAFAVPRGWWSVTVIARDAAGNVASRRVGLVVGHARMRK